MDHAEALELIELAAAEPDGLDRLMAGDTAEAALVAGHLAGCAACADVLRRTRVVSVLAREIVREQPDPALRERTLALVASVGVPRGSDERAVPATPAAGPSTEPGPGSSGRARHADRARRRGIPIGWVATLAAAVVVTVVATGALVGADRDARYAQQVDELAALTRASSWLLRLEARPDVARISLAGAAPDASGSLVYAPSTGELVVLATGLEAPPAGREWACWVEADGARRRLGRMYLVAGLALWAGPVDGLASLPPDAVFGVSLVPVGGADPASSPALLGELQDPST
jgi:hypothetical protein